MTYIGIEMLELLTRLPISGVQCHCHEPRVFGHQIGCLPGRRSVARGVEQALPSSPGHPIRMDLRKHGEIVSKAKGKAISQAKDKW